jgi:hypothetical protein
LRWRAPVLRLAPDWLTQARARLTEVKDIEQPTVRYRLDAIADHLAVLRPRDDPGALTTTIIDAGLMLDRATAQGSILPSGGPFLAVYPRPSGEKRLCDIYLPEGYARAADRRWRAALVLVDTPGNEATVAAQIGRQLAAGTDVVVLTPHLVDEPPTIGVPVVSLPDIEAWASSFLGTERVLLAGIDGGAAAALRSSLADPGTCDAALLLAGRNFAAWWETSADSLATAMSVASNDVSYHWLIFPGETGPRGRAEPVTVAMRRAGMRVDADERVRGGLSLSQAAGRIARWLDTGVTGGTATDR